MAAAAVLPPNQSLEMSLTVTDVSQARQRRRRTSRRPSNNSKLKKPQSEDVTRGDLNIDPSSSVRPRPVDDAFISDLGSSAAVSTPGSIGSTIGWSKCIPLFDNVWSLTPIMRHLGLIKETD